MTSAELKQRYEETKGRIAEAAARAGRAPGEVLLVAVTKYAEADQIRELIQLGQVDFGENRVQQLLQRAAMIDEWLGRQRTLPSTPRARASIGANIAERLAKPASISRASPATAAAGAQAKVRWHMIGHLQRNKAKQAIDAVRLVHSVDSLRLAEELQAAAGKRDHVTDVLLQVNASGERSKYGCSLPAAVHLAEQIDTMVQVRLRGVMTMAALSDNPEHARATFGRCREVFEEIRDAGIASGYFDILSMGMSSDFEVAIQEGANLVRVGSAIFGEPPQGHVEPDDDEAESEK
ncbi:MAG: YggS family pyridoxal phosphate-dependent enzyme [Phycisphaerales bacterium]|nr:YggS family pyridoxal phosphate-dependent enzyme [Phycisphaerales bacterium]